MKYQPSNDELQIALIDARLCRNTENEDEAIDYLVQLKDMRSTWFGNDDLMLRYDIDNVINER